MTLPADSLVEKNSLELSELSPELGLRLRALTPARVGLRRAGTSVATTEVLDFQLAHGRARDAVHAPMQAGTLVPGLQRMTGGEVLLLHSAAADRATYLQRPDFGRRLVEESARRLARIDYGSYDLAIVIADGLSALAIERHAEALLAVMLPALLSKLPDLKIAPVSIVEQGRVAVGDEIALALKAEMVIVLLGERPGLSSPDSLGAYITWKPRPGKTTDAERNCISNIRAEGLSYAEAAARLLHYVREARSKGQTGVALKDPDAPLQQLHGGVE